jgi:hypothetical protein
VSALFADAPRGFEQKNDFMKLNMQIKNQVIVNITLLSLIECILDIEA